MVSWQQGESGSCSGRFYKMLKPVRFLYHHDFKMRVGSFDAGCGDGQGSKSETREGQEAQAWPVKRWPEVLQGRVFRTCFLNQCWVHETSFRRSKVCGYSRLLSLVLVCPTSVFACRVVHVTSSLSVFSVWEVQISRTHSCFCPNIAFDNWENKMRTSLT